MAIAAVSLEDNASLWDVGREVGVAKMRFQNHPELVNQVCPECMYWHDTVWDVDDVSAPEPPLHAICACTMVPEFEPGSEIGTDPDGNPIVADPPPALEPGEHLDNEIGDLKAARVDEILGPTRGQLIRAGVYDASEMVRAGSVRHVENLLSTAGMGREEFAAMTQPEMRARAEGTWRDQQERPQPRRRTRDKAEAQILKDRIGRLEALNYPYAAQRTALTDAYTKLATIDSRRTGTGRQVREPRIKQGGA
jgi:hypothetical protein